MPLDIHSTVGSPGAGLARRVPQARHVGVAAARRRDLVAEPREVGPGRLRRDPALRRPIEEPEPEQERLVDVLDRLDLLRQHGGERLDADRSRRELLDDRREELAVGRVEALVVDLHLAHRRGRGRLVDPAVAVDLGVVAGPLQEPVDDPRRAPAAAGDRSLGAIVDRDLEDPRRPVDDRREVVLLVEVEPVGRAEPIAKRGARSGPPASWRPTTVNGFRLRRRLRALGPLPIITSRAKSSIAG